jgi:hypothetical protein
MVLIYPRSGSNRGHAIVELIYPRSGSNVAQAIVVLIESCDRALACGQTRRSRSTARRCG